MKIRYKLFALVAVFVCNFSFLVIAQNINEGVKLLQSERYEDAQGVFKSIMASNPANGEAYFYYGESILKSYTSDPFSNTMAEVVKESDNYFKTGLQKDSTNALNLIGIGMTILLQKNDTSAADAYFKKAEQSLPKKAKKYTEKDIVVLMKLGSAQLYAAKPRYNKAVAYLEKAKEGAPNNTDVYITLGDIYVSQNNASTAVANYNKAVYLNPELAIPKVKIGHLYMRSRNIQEARNYFEQAKEIDSTYAPLYRALGEMWAMGGQPNQSKNNFKKFLSLSGNNIPAKIQYVNSLFKARDYKEVIKNIDDILQFDKSRNYLYRIAAYSAYEMKPADYQKGRTYIETFFQNADPEKVIAKDYAYYGRILLRLRDTSVIDQAFDKLITAYKMDTTDSELLTDIAANAYFSKRFHLAIEMINKKIDKGTALPADYMNLGKTYYQLAQGEKIDTAIQNDYYRKAEKVFAKITEIDTLNVQAFLWRANTAFSIDPESKLESTRNNYKAVIEKGHSDTIKFAKELFDAYSYMGSSYLFAAKSDYENAEIWYTKILNLDSKNKQWLVRAYSSLGIIYTKRKNYPAAIGYYKKALELDPRNDSYQKTIDGLNKAIKAQQSQ